MVGLEDVVIDNWMINHFGLIHFTFTANDSVVIVAIALHFQ